MILTLIGALTIGLSPEGEMPRVLRIRVVDLPLGSVGRAVNERLLAG